MNDSYSLQDVSRILGTPDRLTRRLVSTALPGSPRARADQRFGFHDLVLLKTAHGLVRAGLSTARIRRALDRLRTRLPADMPLAGLRIEAIGDTIAVGEGASRWAAESGQYLLGFEVSAVDGRVSILERAAADAQSNSGTAAGESTRHGAGDDAGRLFELGLELHEVDPVGACEAYERAIACDPAHAGAHANLGLLHQERGRLREAERAYQQGLERCPRDPTMLFNLGVLLEEMARDDEAAACYRGAIEAAPDLADAHLNLARVFERAGRLQEALRHFSAYRRLTR